MKTPIYFLFTGNEHASVRNGFRGGDLVYKGKREIKPDTVEDMLNFAQCHLDWHCVYILHSVVGVRL